MKIFRILLLLILIIVLPSTGYATTDHAVHYKSGQIMLSSTCSTGLMYMGGYLPGNYFIQPNQTRKKILLWIDKNGKTAKTPIVFMNQHTGKQFGFYIPDSHNLSSLDRYTVYCVNGQIKLKGYDVTHSDTP